MANQEDFNNKLNKDAQSWKENLDGDKWAQNAQLAIDNNEYRKGLAKRYGISQDSIESADDWSGELQRAIDNNEYEDSLDNVESSKWAENFAENL